MPIFQESMWNVDCKLSGWDSFMFSLRNNLLQLYHKAKNPFFDAVQEYEVIDYDS